jgi:hypothetical protein
MALPFLLYHYINNWGGRIRTYVWRLQKTLPYRLATPQTGQEGIRTPDTVVRSHVL